MSDHIDDQFDHDDGSPRPGIGGLPIWAIVLLCAIPVVVLIAVGGAIATFGLRTSDIERAEAQARNARTGDDYDYMRPPELPEILDFEVHLYTFPRIPDDRSSFSLVRDTKKTVANPKQVFLISKEQAARLIKYLAFSGDLKRNPPSMPNTGWYAEVRGMFARIQYWHFRPDVKPETTEFIEELLQILDGEAKAAVERFCNDVGKLK